jgi:RNA polymerase sigma factor (sigma-70 family)
MGDSDMELLTRYLRQHAEDAFAELVRRHLGLVYSAALRQIHSPQLAEEVAQSVFIDLARNAARLKPNTILTAWLYQVTRRTAIDVVRREASRQLREQIATEMNAMNATAADWTHVQPLLDEAMHALDETDRAAVLLRYFENKSLREVGATLGTSENAAQKRLGRAVEHLREFFTKRGVTVGASRLVVVISANGVQAAPVGLAFTISTAAALAGTTIVTTSTATATKAIAMTTTQKVLITTVLAAAASTGLYEAREASRARNSVKTLQQQQAALEGQIQELTHEREEATRRLAGTPDDDRLNRATTELLRLRGEVAMLRREREEMLTRPAAATGTGSATAERRGVDTNWVNAILVVGRDQLVDTGNATPEAAWESRYWARAHGDYDAVIAATDPQMVDVAKAWMGDQATFRERSQTQFAGFKGLQILARKNVSNDRVELKYQFAFGDNPTRQETKIVEMVKIEGAWKSGQTRAYDASWDASSQPESQP